MNARRRILIVPSWYPSVGNPTRGVFFKEQAELVADAFDIRVLTAERNNRLGRMLPPRAWTIQKEEDTVPVYRFLLHDLVWLPDKLRAKFKVWQYQRAFNKLINGEQWKPDLLHGHSTFFGGIYAYALSRFSGISFMITEHSPLDMDMFKVGHAFRYYALDALRSAKLLLAVSYSRRREIIWHLPNIDPATIGNLVDENVFTLRPLKTEQTFRVLIVAQMNAVKDLATFFKTAQLLAEKYGDKVIFDVVGYNGWGGDNEAEIRQLASRFGIEKRCLFRGNVNRSEMVATYHAADAFMLTSIAEGMPVSVLEALSTGTPVFATRCGGVEELIDHNNGTIVELKDAFGLARSISEVIEGKRTFEPAVIRAGVISRYGKSAFHAAICRHYSALTQGAHV
jgi:glycosyltransferase involved in cell wall biosynthesis